ncbi:MAG: 4Fe-4S binding protein [Acidobacteriia bacterium]|nr:4Fe-4S binding protein [Terriglobia bacterium]
MIDLLRIRIFSRLAASRTYPRAARIFTLAAFGLLIAGGLAVPHVSEKMAGTLRNTNLAALIVWSLWWPLVIITASVLGRIWCQICPMELVNSLVSRIGLKKKAPRFFTSGWGIAVFYSLALLGFIRTFSANRYPERMAMFFLFLLASAFVAGLVFERRAFCDHLCPVGRILGLYACCAILEWRVRDARICEACRGRDCAAGSNPGPTAGCPSRLFPASVKDNRDCLVCTQCRKHCPEDNLRLSVRKPMADFFSGLRLRNVELYLLFLVSGLVVWELAEEWSPARSVLEFVPAAINSRLGFSGEAATFIQTLFLFVVVPALLFLTPGLAGKWLNKTTLLESAKAFGLMFLPLVALGHSVKAVFRITSRLPYYELAFRDPVGYSTAAAISSGNIRIETRLADAVAPWISWLALLIFAGAILSVSRIAWASPTSRSFARPGRISHLVTVTIYGAALITIMFFARF